MFIDNRALMGLGPIDTLKKFANAGTAKSGLSNYVENIPADGSEEYDANGNMISFGGPIDWTSLGQTVDAPLSVEEATLYGEFNKPKQPAKSVPTKQQKKASNILAEALGIGSSIPSGEKRYVPSQRDRRGIAGMLDTMAESSGYNVGSLSNDPAFVGMRQDQVIDQLVGLENRDASLYGKGADARRSWIGDNISDAENANKFNLTTKIAQQQGAESIADRLMKVMSQKPDDIRIKLFEALTRKRSPTQQDDEDARMLLDSMLGR